VSGDLVILVLNEKAAAAPRQSRPVEEQRRMRSWRYSGTILEERDTVNINIWTIDRFFGEALLNIRTDQTFYFVNTKINHYNPGDDRGDKVLVMYGSGRR
jgi:hypothetical protein